MFKFLPKNIDLKSILLQCVLFVGVFGLGYYFLHNTLQNLSSLGVTPGFTFLAEPAGYDIPFSFYPLPLTPTHFDIFLAGLSNTLAVSFMGILLATLIGFVVGVAQLSSNWLLAKLAKAYVEVFRNIPVLLQIIFWYTGVLSALPMPKHSITLWGLIYLNLRGLYFPKPIFHPNSTLFFMCLVLAIIVIIVIRIFAKQKQHKTGKKVNTLLWALVVLVGLPALSFIFFPHPVSWQIPVLQGFNFVGGVTFFPEFVALWFALSVYTGAFIAEAVRAALSAVDKGQREAAYSLGLKRSLVLRLVIIPQSLKILIPPLISNYLNLLKNSSLAMAIGFPDIVATLGGTTLMQTGQAIESLAIVMATYAFFSLSISLFLNWYNHYIVHRS